MNLIWSKLALSQGFLAYPERDSILRVIRGEQLDNYALTVRSNLYGALGTVFKGLVPKQPVGRWFIEQRRDEPIISIFLWMEEQLAIQNLWSIGLLPSPRHNLLGLSVSQVERFAYCTPLQLQLIREELRVGSFVR